MSREMFGITKEKGLRKKGFEKGQIWCNRFRILYYRKTSGWEQICQVSGFPLESFQNWCCKSYEIRSEQLFQSISSCISIFDIIEYYWPCNRRINVRQEMVRKESNGNRMKSLMIKCGRKEWMEKWNWDLKKHIQVKCGRESFKVIQQAD